MYQHSKASVSDKDLAKLMKYVKLKSNRHIVSLVAKRARSDVVRYILPHRHLGDSRTLMGRHASFGPRNGGANEAPHQCPLESVARYFIYADVRNF